MIDVQPELPRAEGIRRFDWEEIEDQTILRIVGLQRPAPTEADQLDVPDTCWEIAFQTEKGWLHLSVNSDTDELVVEIEDSQPAGDLEGLEDGEAWLDLASLSDLIGTEIGWCWSARNSQGYWDMFVISTGICWPHIAFFGIASRIEVFRIEDPRQLRIG